MVKNQINKESNFVCIFGCSTFLNPELELLEEFISCDELEDNVVEIIFQRFKCLITATKDFKGYTIVFYTNDGLDIFGISGCKTNYDAMTEFVMSVKELTRNGLFKIMNPPLDINLRLLPESTKFIKEFLKNGSI